jgi:hypothetical protein
MLVIRHKVKNYSTWRPEFYVRAWKAAFAKAQSLGWLN